MTIYDMLQTFVNGMARKNILTKQEAFEATNLIAKLRKINALGTMSTLQRGEYPDE